MNHLTHLIKAINLLPLARFGELAQLASLMPLIPLAQPNEVHHRDRLLRTRRCDHDRFRRDDSLARRRASGIAVLALAAIAAGTAMPTASADVVAFDAQPEHNSVEWRGFAEATGAVVTTPMEFSTHPEGALDREWFLCSHGAVIEGVCMNEVAFGSGAVTGALVPPLSAGEGPLGETSFVYNAWDGAWEVVVSFRRPVVGVGIMTADHFNPFGVNAMTLEVFDGLHGDGRPESRKARWDRRRVVTSSCRHMVA